MPFTVQELIKDRRKPVTVQINDTAQKAIDLMMEYDFSQLPVIDNDERPQGMVTSDSILRAHASLNLPLKKLHVRDAIAKKPREFKAADDLFEMLEYVMDADAVFIVEGDGRLTGIVTSYDTTEYFRRRAEDIMLVEDIETALREHIRSAYSGPKGLDHDALKVAVGEVVRDRGGHRKRFKAALKRYANSKGLGNIDEDAAETAFNATFASGGAGHEFEDLNLSEYIQMLLHGDRWDTHFQSLFNIEREALKFMLDAVRETRNTLAHFRGEIDSTQRNHLRFAMEWLGRRQPVVPISSASPIIEPVPAVAPASASTAGTPATPADSMERGLAEELGAEDSRYAPLGIYLQALQKDRIELTFGQIEEIIGGPLPAYARRHRSWWANDSVGHVQSRQWIEAGWRTASINMSGENVAFYRPSERAQAYIEFYNELLGSMEEIAPGLFKGAPPNGQSWFPVRYLPDTGQRIAFLAFAFAHRGRFRVELYIDTGNRETNKSIFDRLHDRRHEIEAQLGEVSWERLDEKRASRVALYHPGSIEESAELLASLRAWGIREMVRLNDVVTPLLYTPTRS